MHRQPNGVRRAQIYLDPDTLKALDEAARAAGLSRSALISQFVKRALQTQAGERA